MSEEKRHAPTPRRLERARQEGEVQKSPLITHSMLLIGCILSAKLLIPYALVRSKILLEWLYTQGFGRPEECLFLSFGVVVGGTSLLLGPALVAGLVAELSQLGWRIGASSVALKLSRVDPLRGLLGALSQLRGSWQFLVRGVIFGFCFYGVFQELLFTSPTWLAGQSDGLIRFFVANMHSIVGRGVLALVLCASLEFVLQRRSFRKRVMMSDQELKQEHRESEGDPLIRGLRRAQHEALSLQEITKRVRGSKVIIVDRS